MSVSSTGLSSRRVSVGQTSSVFCRRVHVPIVAATGDRPERIPRPQRATRPVLREAPRPKSNLVASRLEPGQVQTETTVSVETAEAERQAEEVFVETPPNNLPIEQSEESPSLEPLLSYITESEEWEMQQSDVRGNGIADAPERKGRVLVTKRPSMRKMTEKKSVIEEVAVVELERDRLATQRIIEMRRGPVEGRKKEWTDVEKEETIEEEIIEEEQPKVILAKRPEMKAREVKPVPLVDLGIPTDRAVAKRVDDVLVVRRSAVQARQMRSPVPRPATASPRSIQRTERSVSKPAMGSVAQIRTPSPPSRGTDVSKVRTPSESPVIVRPRPKILAQRPLSSKTLSQEQTPTAPVLPFVATDQILKSEVAGVGIEAEGQSELKITSQTEPAVTVEESAENLEVSKQEGMDIRASLLETAKIINDMVVPGDDRNSRLPTQMVEGNAPPARDAPKVQAPRESPVIVRPRPKILAQRPLPNKATNQARTPAAPPLPVEPADHVLKSEVEGVGIEAEELSMPNVTPQTEKPVTVEESADNLEVSKQEAMDIRASLLKTAKIINDMVEPVDDRNSRLPTQMVERNAPPARDAPKVQAPSENPVIVRPRPKILAQCPLPNKATNQARTPAAPPLPVKPADHVLKSEVAGVGIEAEELSMPNVTSQTEKPVTVEESADNLEVSKQEGMDIRASLLEIAKRPDEVVKPVDRVDTHPPKQTEEKDAATPPAVLAKPVRPIRPTNAEGIRTLVQTKGNKVSVSRGDAVEGERAPDVVPEDKESAVNEVEVSPADEQEAMDIRASLLESAKKVDDGDDADVKETVTASTVIPDTKPNQLPVQLPKLMRPTLSKDVGIGHTKENVVNDELRTVVNETRVLHLRRIAEHDSAVQPKEDVTAQGNRPQDKKLEPPGLDSQDEEVRQEPSVDAQQADQIRESLLKSVESYDASDTEEDPDRPKNAPTAQDPQPAVEPSSLPFFPGQVDSSTHLENEIQEPSNGKFMSNPLSEERNLNPGSGSTAVAGEETPEKGPPALIRPSRPMKVPKPAADTAIALDRKLVKEKAAKAKETLRKKRQRLLEERKQARASREEERKTQASKRSDSSLIDVRRKARIGRQTQRTESFKQVERDMIIEVGAEGLSVEALAQLLALEPGEIIRVLFAKGVMVTVNQTLDTDSVKVVAAEFEVEVLDKTEGSVTDMAKKDASFCEDDDENALNRPPIVTVMGHVDHGKTSLLDYIRETQVADGEAGGITQAIGAYTCSVEVEDADRTVCFLDTPGHEAFSAMRARGAHVTDIAIVVVAANDGIRPQTIEAISHAQAAEVPIVIAINKIDVPGADPEKVKRELSEIDLLPEEWGGKTPVVELSAKTGEGVVDLLELLILVADIQLNLRANPDAPAKGTVVEASVDKRSGAVASVLVQNGTLHVGDILVAGGAFGKVRSLTDAQGVHVDSAGPSTAVQVLGLHEVPVAGDVFSVCDDETTAKEEAEKVAAVIRSQHLAEAAGGGSMVTLSSLASVDDEEAVSLQRINLVLKTDTSGSLEAVKGALGKLPQDSVMLRYLHSAPGEMTEADVLLAAAAEGMVVGFNVPITEGVRAAAKRNNVELHSYTVIYDLISDVRNSMEGRLSPTEDRLVIGEAEVRAVFGAGSRRVAGCMVAEGRLEKDCLIRVIRKNKNVFEGELSSLRRVKDKVEEVSAGLECGVGSDAFSEWQEGDRIEAFTVVQKNLTLEESHATTAVNEDELQQLIN